MSNRQACGFLPARYNGKNYGGQIGLYRNSCGRIVQFLKKFSNLKICQIAAEANK